MSFNRNVSARGVRDSVENHAESLILLHRHDVTLNEGGIGIFGFTVFGPKDFGFSVLVFIAVCGVFVFQHLVFGFGNRP